MTFIETLKLLYFLVGVTLAVTYLPQIHSAWVSTNRAKDVSMATWGFWCFTSLISLLYAVVVVQDKMFSLVSLGNLAGCIAVTAVAAVRRFGPLRTKPATNPIKSTVSFVRRLLSF